MTTAPAREALGDRRITDLAHAAVAASIGEGSLVVDATAGNGHDALILARAVGATGHVLAIDLQPRAIASTREHLGRHDLEPRATLVAGDHARLDALVPADWAGRVDAVMFNLGYLPRTDHALVTAASTTLPAIDAAIGLLAPGGVATVLAYTGHAEGVREAAAIEGHLAGGVRGFDVRLVADPGGRDAGTPELWILRRLP